MADEENPSAVPGSDFVVPYDAFVSPFLLGSVSKSEFVEIYSAERSIRAALEAAVQAGNTHDEHALRVLAAVCSYHFKPEDRSEPYGPMMTMGDQRTPIPSDLLREQRDVLSQVVERVEHPALRARMADICWMLNRRDATSGLVAVESFSECVRLVLDGEGKFEYDEANPAGHSAEQQLTRATVIARALGWERSDFDKLRDLIANILSHAVEADDGWGFVQFGDLNLNNGIWKDLETARAAEELVASEKLTQDPYGQRALWQLAARSYRAAKEVGECNRCQMEAAETYVAEADARSGSALVEAHFLNDAIQALRPLPGTAGRRKILHERLTAVQSRIHEEMASISHETDITDLVNLSSQEVQGRNLASALAVLFLCDRSPDPEKLREDVMSAASPGLADLFSTVVSDSQGRTRFVAPGLGSAGTWDANQLRLMVNRNESLRRQLVVSGWINPIRRAISSEHCISSEMIMPLMQASPFVPPGHEFIFSQGASKFIVGDDLQAAHLLLPQLEKSLRHILSLAGVETNRINQDGTQEEAMLRRLLGEYGPQLSEIIGPPLLNEIDLLFNFRGGPSVRHELAHGKMTANAFWSTEVTYSIWLVLHITVLPTIEDWDRISPYLERYC